jgi:hypothetical protein
VTEVKNKRKKPFILRVFGRKWRFSIKMTGKKAAKCDASVSNQSFFFGFSA